MSERDSSADPIVRSINRATERVVAEGRDSQCDGPISVLMIGRAEPAQIRDGFSSPASRQGPGLANNEALLAGRAVIGGDSVHGAGSLEDSFDALVEAVLTNVVHRLRASWLAGPALLWGDVHPVSKFARSDLDKRIATLLVQGFARYSQLLAGLEVLLRDRKQFGVVSEESLLSLEQLLVDARHLDGDQRLISEAGSRPADVDRGSDSRAEAGNE